MLLKADCICEHGKGSHTKWSHPLLNYKITISGKDGSDAKRFLRQFLQRAEHPQRTVALSREGCKRFSQRY